METKEALKANESKQQGSKNDEYRENIKKVIDNEVKKAIDLEIQQAAQELIEEHKKSDSANNRGISVNYPPDCTGRKRSDC
jgi:3-dehydroquinate dehydratase